MNEEELKNLDAELEAIKQIMLHPERLTPDTVIELLEKLINTVDTMANVIVDLRESREKMHRYIQNILESISPSSTEQNTMFVRIDDTAFVVFTNVDENTHVVADVPAGISPDEMEENLLAFFGIDEDDEEDEPQTDEIDTSLLL